MSIDLGAVSFVDAKGRDLLLRMQREGLSLKGPSGFLRQLLEDANINFEQLQKKRS